jgi:hypothetical protein
MGENMNNYLIAVLILGWLCIGAILIWMHIQQKVNKLFLNEIIEIKRKLDRRERT